MRLRRLCLAAALLLSAAATSNAGEAEVIDVTATAVTAGMWRFDVTVRHADEGWEHYADRFEVLSLDGTVLGTRVLLHPHETEQPFTRSLEGVAIPAGTTEVEVRAHDSVHGFGGVTMRVKLQP